MANKTTPKTTRPSYLNFTKAYVKEFRKEGQTGIHSVYSNFNSSFRAMFPEKDVVDWLKEAEKAGTVHSPICRGGSYIVLAEDWQERKSSKSAKAKKQGPSESERRLAKVITAACKM